MMYDIIYTVFIYLQLGSAVAVFVFLFFMIAPYGRHFRKGWGVVINEKIAWILMEFPAFFIPLLFFIIGRRYLVIPSIIFLLTWELHYVQRTFVFPALIPYTRKNFPVLVALMGFSFNIINGYLQGYYLFMKTDSYTISWLLDIRFLTGLAVFLCGFLINLISDKKLRNLKKDNKGTYSIPNGGLFNYISSPNYFGEIIEWLGWAVLTWSLPGVLFAVFTIANLLPRAISHHKWYKDNFPEYPEKRKAIIPFLL